MATQPPAPTPKPEAAPEWADLLSSDPSSTASSTGEAGGAPVEGSPSSEPGGGATPQPETSAEMSFFRGIGRGISFEYLDEAGAVADSLLPDALNIDNLNPNYNRRSVWNSNLPLTKLIAENKAINRAQLGADDKENFWWALGGQMTGGAAVPLGAAPRTFGGFMKVAAAQGFVTGTGAGEGLEDSLEKGAIYAGGAAALTPLLWGGMKLGGKLIAKGLEKIRGPKEPLEVDVGLGGRVTGEVAAADEMAQIGDEAATSGGRIVGWVETQEGRQPIWARNVSVPKATKGGAPLTEAGASTEAASSAGAVSKLPETPDEMTAFQAAVEAQKARIGADPAAANIPADSPQGQFMLGNLGDDAASTIRTLIPLNTAKVARSDEQLMTAASLFAKDIGEDPEAMLAWGRMVAGQLGEADTAMATFRVLWQGAGDEVYNLNAAGVDWASASDEMVVSAAEAIRNLSVLSLDMQKVKTGLGRGLRATQLPTAEEYVKGLQKGISNGGPPLDDVPRSRAPLPNDREAIRSWFTEYDAVKDDPKRLAQWLQDALTVPSGSRYLRTSFASLFTANILSGTRTLAVNLTGPALMNTIRMVERSSGGAIAAMNPALSSEQRAAAWAVAKAAPQTYFRMLGDVKDVFKEAVRAGKAGHTIIGGGGLSREAFLTMTPMTENLLSAANVEPNMMYTMGNAINVWPRHFANLNNGLDEFTKRVTYQGEIRINALLEAEQKGLTGSARWEYADEAVRGAYDEVGAASDRAALASTERSTLTSRPGPEGSWVRRFSSGMQNARRDYPELRYVVPVFNVPVNALGEALERTPLAFIPGLSGPMGFSRNIADLRGANGAVAQAEAHGRALLAGGLLTFGTLMASQGMLTGAAPTDKTDRANWLASGMRPYSIRIGDQWVDIMRLDVLGPVLSIPATLFDASVYRPADKALGDMMLGGVGALMQWFKDRAALRTVSDLLSLGDDPMNSAEAFLGRFSGSVASGMVPGSGMLRSITNVTDEQQRMHTSWFDYIKAGVPGLSNTMEPVRNILGAPMRRSADTYAEQFAPVTFSPAVSFQEDPVLDELLKTYQATGYGAGADPGALSYGHFNPREVELEDGVSIYTHAMRKRQDFVIDGVTLNGALAELFASDEYGAGVDGRPGFSETSQGEAIRATMIQQVFDRYNKAIKAQLAQESPAALKWMTAAAVLQRDNAYLKGLTAKDIAGNPSLLTARGIDGQAFADDISGGAGALLEALPE